MYICKFSISRSIIPHRRKIVLRDDSIRQVAVTSLQWHCILLICYVILERNDGYNGSGWRTATNAGSVAL